MRLDKYLKLTRLIKRRTVANEVADAGRITVNGKPVKASYAVKEGDVIGIADGSIESVGSSTEEVVMALLTVMDADDADTLTILAGEDIDDDAFDALVARIEEAHEDLEIDAHRGDQPLYPIVMSVE